MQDSAGVLNVDDISVQPSSQTFDKRQPANRNNIEKAANLEISKIMQGKLDEIS